MSPPMMVMRLIVPLPSPPAANDGSKIVSVAQRTFHIFLSKLAAHLAAQAEPHVRRRPSNDERARPAAKQKRFPAVPATISRAGSSGHPHARVALVIPDQLCEEWSGSMSLPEGRQWLNLPGGLRLTCKQVCNKSDAVGMRGMAMKSDILGGIGIVAFLIMIPQSATAQWTGEMTVTSAFVQDSDALVVYTAGGSNNGCVSNAWVIVAANEDRRARLWATVLTALSLGKKLSFWFNGGCGTFGYHQASAVQISS